MSEMLEHAVAVIGMSGRFPDANNIEDFWKHILESKESTHLFSDKELIDAGISRERIHASHYVKRRGILDNIELFDADFFGIPSYEAELIDPQHRLFLECAFEALENANCRPDQYPGLIGVYGGTGRSLYFLHHLFPDPELMDKKEYLIRIGNEPDFFTTKVSHKLNLKGPSLTIQTACSTSLVSICVACNHLLTYQCDVALAGGASIFIPQKSGYFHQEGMIFSPDGHCKPFDAGANGTVPSNGIGVVVLKRLEDALADRDYIYAIVRGYGLNNDGKEKMGYSAPSVMGQVKAIESAIAMAGVNPETISYAEAHGTATFLGDPIEMEALTQAFRQYTQKKGFCGIGSVKSNIGHSMEAAGVTGFIKAALSLHEKKIPPTINFEIPSPHLNLENSPFYINTALKDWTSNGSSRRSCVSSFGIGGTNAHVILEEAPKSKVAIHSMRPQLLILSAKTEAALEAMAQNLGNHLKCHPEISLEDVAYSLQVGRMEFECRKAIVCRDREGAIAALLGNNQVNLQLESPYEENLAMIGNSWNAGHAIDWSSFWSESKPSRIPLPTYPFQKRRYWIDPPALNKLETPQLKEKKTSTSREEILLEIWKKNLRMDAIDVNNDFFALGGDSLLAIQVISEIEKELGISLKLQTLYQFPTLAQLTAAISTQIVDGSCLVLLKEGDGHCPLFIIHGIDGNIFSYKALAKAMTFKGSIYGVQAHIGKTGKIEELASIYVKEILKVQPKGPYLLCGHSFGGILAYEMARQLNQEERFAGFITMIDAINPACEFVPYHNEREMLVFLMELLTGEKTSIDALQKFTPVDLEKKIIEGMGLDVLPAVQQQKTIEQVRQHIKALELYRPEPYGGDIIFIQARERFSRMKNIPLSTTWSPLIKGKMTVIETAGTHLGMLLDPHVWELAKLLDTVFLKASAS